MISKSGKTWASVALIAIGLACASVLTRYVESARPPLPSGYADQDLAVEGARLKGFVFGAEGLAADWYWMNSLQYVGNKISVVGLDNLNLDDLTPLNPRLLYPYLNNATDLDPHFIAPYTYGATLLPAIDPQQAIALTEKGIASNPDEWRLHQYLGYIYWKTGDYEKSSDVYRRGSEISGAPVFLRMMAARMKTEGGSRNMARDMYRQLRDDSQDNLSRQNAELRLMQIDSLDERDLLNAALSEYRNSNNRCATKWSEIFPIVQKKAKSGPDLKFDRSNNFVDPSGEPYTINQGTCTTDLGSNTKVPRV
ncbi:MAG TPA: hypothetical protein VJV05_12415 [Pyrinomonadaceae bacterium]|nr:hypothetical protein [Pyrinomonadaceae bacterium]